MFSAIINGLDLAVKGIVIGAGIYTGYKVAEVGHNKLKDPEFQGKVKEKVETIKSKFQSTEK